MKFLLFGISLIFILSANCAPMKEQKEKKQVGGLSFEAHVMDVFDKKATEDFQEVIFTPSARYYRLAVNQANYQAVLKVLLSAKKEQKLVVVTLTTPFGDNIADVSIVDKK